MLPDDKQWLWNIPEDDYIFRLAINKENTFPGERSGKDTNVEFVTEKVGVGNMQRHDNTQKKS